MVKVIYYLLKIHQMYLTNLMYLEWQLQPGERKREAVWERMLRRGWGPP